MNSGANKQHSSSLRLSVYSKAQRNMLIPLLLPLVVSGNCREQRKSDWDRLMTTIGKKTPGVRRLWFHAASVGELESIWEIIIRVAGDPCEIVLTVFSESARKSADKLAQELARLSRGILYSGYSPVEGCWGEAIARIQPDVFVTAKYEAWPELWASLGLAGIPLAVFGAKMRNSFRTAKLACSVLGTSLPQLSFFTVREQDSVGLRQVFPNAHVERLGEPRWDRVQGRSARTNPRVSELVSRFGWLSKPWGIFGSAWIEDLEFWGDELLMADSSFWMVPHDVKPDNVRRMRDFLEKKGFQVFQSSSQPADPGQKSETAGARGGSRICVIVDEMGILLELYSYADWAFVGGGFGKGIHSVIEPAISGLPVAAGPKNHAKFPEMSELCETGQLTLLRSKADLKTWNRRLPGLLRPEVREQWMEQARGRLGSTAKAVEAIARIFEGSCS